MNDKTRIFPDFFIVGAQKAGTATLSDALVSRSDVFMSTPREPMFFCRDDHRVHPHGLLAANAAWAQMNWAEGASALHDEYARYFRDAGSRRVGEGSASYLHAERVPERIAKLNPSARIIISLRDPVARAYSAYWHHIKNFRAVWSFEDTLAYEPWDLLEIGRYPVHLRRWCEHFPREQIHVVLFERLTEDWSGEWRRLCSFLSLPPDDTPLPHANKALVPTAIRTQRVLNLALRLVGSDMQASALRSRGAADRRPLSLRLLDKGIRGMGKVNRSLGAKYPRMKEETRARLTEWFRRENEGLEPLVGIDPGAAWWRNR